MDKTKITQAATKYVQKGQYDKAIAEYRKILEKDAKDVRILLKVGELQQKKGENEAAATTLEGVAAAYAADGFFLKAVAVYKQVLKLSPERVEVILRLAELYQQLGLMSDAMVQFQAASAHYDRKGAVVESMEILRRMVSLDPENLASRMRLAEHLVKLEKRTEALEELRRAAEQLRGGSRLEDYLRVGERIVHLDPGDQVLGRELAQAYLAKNDVRRALERLQVCFQQDPRNPETLELLARAFAAVGQRPKAASVYKELARIHRDQARGADEQAAWRKVLELAPEDAEARQALGMQPAPAAPRPVVPPRLSQAEAPVVAPARPAAPPTAAAAPASAPAPARAPVAAQRSQVGSTASAAAPARPAPVELARLLTETDVFVKYGLEEKARAHLQKIFELDPDNIAAHEKAVSLLRGKDPAGFVASLAAVARLCARAGEPERGRPCYEELRTVAPDHPEVGRLAAVYGGAAAKGGADLGDEAGALPGGDEPLILPVEAGEEAVDAADLGAPAFSPISEDALLALADEAGQNGDLIDEPLLVGPAGAVRDDELIALASDGGGGEVVEDPLLGAPAGGVREEELIALASDVAGSEVVEDPLLGAPAGLVGDDELLALAGEEGGEVDDSLLGVVGDEPLAVGGGDRSFAVDLGEDEPLFQETGADTSGIELVLDGPEEVEGATRAAPGASGDGATEVALLPEDEILEKTPFMHLGSSTRQVDFGAITAEHDPLAGSLPEAAQRRREPGLAPEPVAPPAPPAEDPVNPWRLAESEWAGVAEELDEAEFYLQQGLLDEAEEIYRSVERRIPGHQQAVARLEEIARMRGPVAPPASVPQPESTVFDRAIPAAPPAPAAAAPALAAPAGEEELFDLGAALADELAAEEAAGGDDAFAFGAEDVLEGLEQGVARTVRPEDVDTHYNLAIAYKEMGLLPDAIGEFELALSGCEGTPRAVDCLTMIGICHGLGGAHRQAVEAFERGLAVPGISTDTEKALRYEVGLAWEAAGGLDQALAAFGQVARLDGNYRDVRSAIARLVAAGAVARPLDGSADAPTAPRARRVDSTA